MNIKKSFGRASDYYRVRVIKIISEGDGEAIWKEGAGYFFPENVETSSEKLFSVQIIAREEGGPVKTMEYSYPPDAKELLKEIEDDLKKQTVNEFRTKYGLP